MGDHMDISTISGAFNNVDNIRAGNTAESYAKNIGSAAQSNDDAKLMEACRDFESYFIQTLYRQMRSSAELINSGSRLFEKSQGEKIFQDMLDEEYAKKAADNGGIGLATFLYKQLKRQEGIAPDDVIAANTAAEMGAVSPAPAEDSE